MFQAGLAIYTINRNGGKACENEGERYEHYIIKVGISCTVIIMLHQCMVDKMKSSDSSCTIVAVLAHAEPPLKPCSGSTSYISII